MITKTKVREYLKKIKRWFLRWKTVDTLQLAWLKRRIKKQDSIFCFPTRWKVRPNVETQLVSEGYCISHLLKRGTLIIKW